MAFAYLEEESLRGVAGRAFRVLAEPFGTEPYEGPTDRDWDQFVASEDGGYASYSYRTGPDRIRELARAVREDRMALDEATADETFGPYLGTVEDRLARIHLGDKDGFREALEAGLRALANGSVDPSLPDKPFAFYLDESEEYLHEAARALPLPPWAHRESVSDGGPGSGFDAAFLILDPPFSLTDLARWLDEVAAGKVEP